MGIIRELPEDLVKKIAAGEVIERPASVVKELVENSIDAKATRIEVETGRNAKYIKVSDNGEGIDPDDIPFLFKRHATSKIKTFEDLWTAGTLGFRGEALASISAVSKIKCLSRHKESEHGFELIYTNGKLDKKTAAVSTGTIIEIDDLFFNVPARQKFLKTEKTELNHIYDVVLSEALSHPEISFKLLSNNNNVTLETSGSEDLQLVINELLGTDLRDNLIFISSSNKFSTLSGYVSTLNVHRLNKKSVFIFVNKRPVRCQIVSKAIQNAYEGLLPSGGSPVVVLDLKFQPKFVDINVHPAKKEVRYSSPNDVYNIVLNSIQNSISNYYKKEYREKSVYSLPELNVPISYEASSQVKRNEDLYSSAAFSLYTNPDYEAKVQEPPSNLVASSFLFSVRNLTCSIVHNNSPVANMTRTGNKILFETGLIFEENLQIVFSGEIVGDDSYNKQFFNFLAELGKGVYESYLKKKEDIKIQKTLTTNIYNEEEISKEEERKKPPRNLLYEVWERDFWTCVYCGKKLLDPQVVKEAIKNSENAFTCHFNEKGDKVTTHVLCEHSASYDHYYPVSKLPQFNFEKDNLFACCLECNKKKSDSMEVKSWIPKRQNNWDTPLNIGGLCFKSPSLLPSLT